MMGNKKNLDKLMASLEGGSAKKSEKKPGLKKVKPAGAPIGLTQPAEPSSEGGDDTQELAVDFKYKIKSNGQVTFTSLYQGDEELSWDLGDGELSSEVSPTKTYEAGKHTVTLTVKENAKTRTFTVKDQKESKDEEARGEEITTAKETVVSSGIENIIEKARNDEYDFSFAIRVDKKLEPVLKRLSGTRKRLSMSGLMSAIIEDYIVNNKEEIKEYLDANEDRLF